MSEAYVNCVGIDLGTTNSAIACVNQYGKPEIIANAEGERITPSAVVIEPDGVPLVGIEAVNQALIEPERTIRLIKHEAIAYREFDQNSSSRGMDLIAIT